MAQGCSDIHLAVGVPPMLRLRGDALRATAAVDPAGGPD